ncbi:MAG: MaoC family dehydratase [Dehalococcoidales bacterium]|nr:MaoC family dehydratase [Dehalococcoidales bacterium]
MKEKENSSPLSFKELPVGFEFSPTSYELSEPTVAKYLEAVDESADFLALGMIPPLAIAACAMTALAQSFTVPPGSIHASQEFEFLKLVPIGSRVSCGGKIGQKLARGNLNLIVLQINVLDESGEPVLSGKATIAAPN